MGGGCRECAGEQAGAAVPLCHMQGPWACMHPAGVPKKDTLHWRNTQACPQQRPPPPGNRSLFLKPSRSRLYGGCSVPAASSAVPCSFHAAAWSLTSCQPSSSCCARCAWPGPGLPRPLPLLFGLMRCAAQVAA